MKYELLVSDEIIYDNFSIIKSNSLDFTLCIKLTKYDSIESKLNNKKLFLKCMKQQLTTGKMSRSDKYRKIIKNLINEYDHLLNNCKFIRLNFSREDDNLFFLKNNKCLDNKKIVIGKKLNFDDFERLKQIEAKYNNQNLYFILNGNDDYVDINDCYKTMNIMEEIINKIKSMNLSPIEKIMYVYDLVKSRIYKEEDESQSKTASRDITKILLGENIVCVGYSRLFQLILTNVGINCHNVILKTKNEHDKGHERNIIYVKDDKYKIDGVYYFDSTWDSKKDIDDIYYIDNYNCFAKTINEMRNIENNEFIYEDSPFISDNYEKDISNYLSKQSIIEKSNLYRQIGYMSKILNDYKNINILYFMKNNWNEKEIKEISKTVEKLGNKFTKPISAETMIKIFCNVRKIEYYQNPLNFSFDPENICSALVYSNWKFEKHHYNKKQERYIEDNDTITNLINFIKENQILKQIGEVKLTKTLSKILDNKKNK